MKAMRRLRRSDCSVLKLELKRKWYDMIESGEKKEEYREFKKHWWTRFSNWDMNAMPDGDVHDVLNVGMKPQVVAFSLGYRKADMFFIADAVLDPEYSYPERKPHPEWGEPDMSCPHYVIRLGERIELVE